MDISNSRWIRAAEAAKLMRKALKRTFPSTKFYVQTRHGSAVSVSWVDGPTEKEAEELLGAFDGQGFDGSIDMRYYVYSWLLPDGSTSIAYTQGTQGSRGMCSAMEVPRPDPKAELVKFGCGLNSLHRYTSRALVEKVAAEITYITGWDPPEIVNETAFLTRTKRAPVAAFRFDFKRQSEYRHFQETLEAKSLAGKEA